MPSHTLAAPGKGISLSFTGSDYPDPLTGQNVTQTFKANILCDTEDSEPKFESYDGKELFVTWHSKAGCEMGSPQQPSPTEPKPGEGEKEGQRSVGSGIGYFFLLCVVSLDCRWTLTYSLPLDCYLHSRRTLASEHTTTIRRMARQDTT